MHSPPRRHGHDNPWPADDARGSTKGRPELTDFRVGFAAAVTTLVHHAAGVRVRERPIKIEELVA